MIANIKANASLHEHMRLFRSLDNDPQQRSRYLPAEARDAVRELAAEIGPRLKDADDAEHLATAERNANDSDVDVRVAIKRLNAGVVSQYGEIPTAVAAVDVRKLGEDNMDNRVILTALHRALQTLPSFSYPANLQPADVKLLIHRANAATLTLQRERERVRGAAAELRVLRSKVDAVWEKHGLSSWIQAIIPAEERFAWGLAKDTRPHRKDPVKAAARAAARQKKAEEAAKKAGERAGTSNGVTPPAATPPSATPVSSDAMLSGGGAITTGVPVQPAVETVVPVVTPPTMNGHDNGVHV